MDNIHKKTLVGLQVEKAKRFLAQADEMVELKHWDLAANRYYYASFHAVQALFIAYSKRNQRPYTCRYKCTI